MRALNPLAECLRIVGLVICGLLFAGGGLLFLDAVCGAISIPLFAAAMMAPIILANYLLWGRRYSRYLRQRQALDDE